MIFLWIFLPIVIAGNYLIGLLPVSDNTKIRTKNIFLLICSMIFYAWGGPRYLLLMLVVILVNYIGGRLISSFDDHKKVFLVTTLFADLLIMIYFKYFNLIVHTIERISGHDMPGFIDVILPIGISFYIFQSMSYTIDVYRNDAKCRNNIMDFALYVSFFPQLIAGPIVQYRDIEHQITSRHESAGLFSEGVNRFIYGLSKKVLLANVFGAVVDDIWKRGNDGIGTTLSVTAAILYSLQIYYDFSGYSDMAIGLGRMLGFKLKENFDLPYTATTVRDFWRRWHISLSSWFKNYVYIPLGGNRLSEFRTCLNIFIVFILTGIWHGANYTFFFWGMYYAVILIAERIVGGLYEKKHLVNKMPGILSKIAGHIYTLVVVGVGWVFFRAGSIGEAFGFIRAFFRQDPEAGPLLECLSLKLCIAFVLAIAFCGPVQKLSEKMKKNEEDNLFTVTGIAARAVLLILCILSLAGDTYNPFIYFQF